ncbi:MAG TPA: LLM class flavin-dependent oxidoreductase [Trebonia sp.]|nr:LLM class flavin-dependent oxidoreductase [Trebonia sp.]
MPTPPARQHPLHFAAVITPAPETASQGRWHPALARRADFDALERQVHLARTLERGKFDAVLFSDAAAPAGDPSVLAGAIAYVTSHLGIAVTASARQEDPLSFARRVSALDHASGGRVTWNLTGDLTGDWLEEYADVTYKLWEGSWDEDALDQAGRAEPGGWGGKVHRINHQGARYQVTGPHPVSPSPQRTPLLFQTGATAAGRAFAAGHAEAVLLGSPSPAAAADDIAAFRTLVADRGRLPRDIKFFQAVHLAAAGIAGAPENLADELANWRAAGIDGVALVGPGDRERYEEFVSQVAPVLQRRGLMQRQYAAGPLRGKLFGGSGRLPWRHPAARYRGAFAPQRLEPASRA